MCENVQEHTKNMLTVHRTQPCEALALTTEPQRQINPDLVSFSLSLH